MTDDLTGARVRIDRFGRVRMAWVAQDRGKKLLVHRDDGYLVEVPRQKAAVLAPPPSTQPLARPCTTDRPKAAPPQPKEGDRSHPRYLTWIRSLPCCWCHRSGPSHAHHWPARGLGGAHGDDLLTVPLCPDDHEHYHRTGAFPGDTPQGSAEVMLREQRRRLAEWIRRMETA